MKYKRTSKKVRIKRIVAWLLNNRESYRDFPTLPIPADTWQVWKDKHILIVNGLKRAGIISPFTSPIDVRLSKYINIAIEKEKEEAS